MTTTVLASFPSPSQGVWYLGPVPIRAYALFIIIGIVVALVIGDRRWEARGGERGVIYDIALWAVPFGLIGGRIYHVITDWDDYFGRGDAGIVGALRIWDGGLGIWGAVAFGGVGAWIACRNRGIPLPAFGDAIAPGIVLAQAIGRLGNYFNQELYGRPTTMPWGLEIYERQNAAGVVSPDLANGVSTGQLDSIVHPTFLYELLWNVLVFAVLIWADRRFKLGHGRLFALYVAGYCLGRFWVELLRADEASMPVDGIRVNSFVSTFVFIGAVVYIMVAPKGREDPATLKGNVATEGLHVDELVEELAAVGATSGVVAAATVAGAEEDEDIGEADDDVGEPESNDETEDETAAADAEVLTDASLDDEAILGDEESDEPDTADGVGEVDSEDEEEPELSAEDVVEAEALTADIAEEPSDEADEHLGGMGAVEGEDAIEAQQAAAEVHEAAVEEAAEAEEVAAEAAAAEADEAQEADAEAESEPADEDLEVEAAEPEADEVEAAEPGADEADQEFGEAVGGVGAVEGEDAVEAEVAAPEAHEVAVEGAEEAEAVAAEVADEPEADEADQEFGEAVGGVGAVEGEDAIEDQQAAAEVHEAAVEEAAEAEEVAAEAAAAESDEAQEAAAEAESEPADEDLEVEAAEPEADEVEAAEPGADEADQEFGEAVGGVGAVEGEDAVEAEVAAPEAHEVAVEGAEEAEAVAAEVADEPEADEADEAELDAEGEEPEGETSEETDAASETEPKAAEAESVTASESRDDSLLESASEPDEEPEPAPKPELPAAAPVTSPVAEPGGRIRRWLRGRLNG